eukprot:Filipodium_phascolosomae@DN7497_c0_g1_i1.p2
MIDEALLRPGRLEVHVEIGLPDETGRLQILNIHTKTLKEAKRMAKDVSLQDLSKRTNNFSGAEIAGLIRSATSFAVSRLTDPNNLAKPLDDEAVIVDRNDFESALEEIKPAFGADDDQLTRIGSAGHGCD